MFNFSVTNYNLTSVLGLSLILIGCGTSSPTVNKPAVQQYNSPKNAIPNGNSTPNLLESSKVNTDLAAAYLQSGQAKTALEVVQTAIIANPSNSPAYALRGLIYGELNNFTDGDRSFKTALSLTPKNSDINHNYGVFLCKNGRTSDSLTYFQAALLDPMYERPLSTHIALGNCLLKLGKIPEARSALNNALRIERFNPTALHSLAKLELVARNFQASRAALEKLTATNGESPQTIYLNIQLAEQTGTENERRILEQSLITKFPNSEESDKINNR